MQQPTSPQSKPNQRPKVQAPCQERYGAMQPTKDGGWCIKCQHEVVDFRGKSNEEIKEAMAIISKPCGLFTAEQLDLSTSKRRPLWYKTRRVAAVAVTLVGFQLSASAQAPMDTQPEKYSDKVCPIEDSPGYVAPYEVHWWQFRKKRRMNRWKGRTTYMGCPSF